jgi:hypothetical protein
MGDAEIKLIKHPSCDNTQRKTRVKSMVLAWRWLYRLFFGQDQKWLRKPRSIVSFDVNGITKCDTLCPKKKK